MRGHRELTRKDRYSLKKKSAKYLPVDLCTINFQNEENLGFLIRAAACFGVKRIHVIGHIPDRSILNSLSGSLYDYVELLQHKTPLQFLSFVNEKNIPLVSAEILESSIPIFDVDFSSLGNFCLVVGNESIGVPPEILRNSLPVHVPMPGVGYCLNTSQAANVALYEIMRQRKSFQK